MDRHPLFHGQISRILFPRMLLSVMVQVSVFPKIFRGQSFLRNSFTKAQTLPFIAQGFSVIGSPFYSFDMQSNTPLSVFFRLRINAVDFPETSASFIPDTGISLSVAHASAVVSANWRMNTWLL